MARDPFPGASRQLLGREQTSAGPIPSPASNILLCLQTNSPTASPTQEPRAFLASSPSPGFPPETPHPRHEASGAQCGLCPQALPQRPHRRRSKRSRDRSNSSSTEKAVTVEKTRAPIEACAAPGLGLQLALAPSGSPARLSVESSGDALPSTVSCSPR